MLTRFLQDTRGTSAVEYSLLAAVIAMGIVAATRSLGTSISGFFARVGTALAAAN